MVELPARMRWCAWLVAGVALLVGYGPVALGQPNVFLVPEINIAAYVISVGMWAVAGGLLLIGRLGPSTSRLLLGATLLTCFAATAVVPAADQDTATSWAFGESGWLVLVFALDRRTPRLAAWLAVPPACALVVTIASVGSLGVEVVGVLGRAGSVLAPQILVALASRRLHRASEDTMALEREAHEMRRAGEVATALHADRVIRAQHVSFIVEPVLAELSTLPSTEPPGDALRRRCAIAGAQVRRLLAEWHTPEPGPLRHELRTCLDEVERLGLCVELAVRGRGDLAVPLQVRRGICEAVLATAHHAQERIRVTVHATRDELQVSVLADASAHAVEALRSQLPVSDETALRTTVHDTSEGLWVEIECQIR